MRTPRVKSRLARSSTGQAWIESSIGTLIDGLRSSDMGISDNGILAVRRRSRQRRRAQPRRSIRGHAGSLAVAVGQIKGLKPALMADRGGCVYWIEPNEYGGRVHLARNRAGMQNRGPKG